MYFPVFYHIHTSLGNASPDVVHRTPSIENNSIFFVPFSQDSFIIIKMMEINKDNIKRLRHVNVPASKQKGK